MLVIPLVAVAVGILLGIFSGMVPGIHSNTVMSVAASLPLPPEFFLYFTMALVAAHLAFQFLPSIFLAIPDDTVVASVLPGHRMALEGRGREALFVCASSLLIASALSAILLPLALFALPALYRMIGPHTAIALIAASCFLLASERRWRGIAVAAGVFILSGALGIATLDAPINDPLFPAFCGLFASSGILLSFTSHRPLPKQGEGSTRLDFLPHVAAGVLFGMLSDLLPGIAAPAQIAVFASVIFPTDDARKFLALVSSIAASHSIFALGALLSIGKAREGSLAMLEEIRPLLPSDLPVLVGVSILSIGVCTLLLMWLSRHVEWFSTLDMKVLNLGILSYLVAMVAIISGGMGLLVFATATAVGLLPPLLGVRRTHVMGFIIVPSIMLAL